MTDFVERMIMPEKTPECMLELKQYYDFVMELEKEEFPCFKEIEIMGKREQKTGWNSEGCVRLF